MPLAPRIVDFEQQDMLARRDHRLGDGNPGRGGEWRDPRGDVDGLLTQIGHFESGQIQLGARNGTKGDLNVDR